MLEAEAQRRKAAHETTTDFIVIPYRSDFLKEIEAALNETVVENENILKLETSLSESSDCTGLHELIVAVQEANQRCRELHINFEFHQQHIIGESGLEPTVRVCDTLKHLAAFWKPANFLQWLCQLRDYEPNDNLKELLHIDLSWEADDWKGKEEDAEAHKSSRILVNMHQIKQQLSDSIQHVSTKLSCNDLDYTHNVNNCLQQMEAAANRLYSLCKNQGELEKINVPLESLHGFIQQLRSVLGTSHSHDVSSPVHQGNSSEDSPHLSGNSPKRKCFPWPLSYGVPRKSNLRSPCPTRTSQTQKAVRFFLTRSQQDQSPE
ncbi:hypothetical protein B7P43_G01261 [Cryptotermes secundus]|uniref:Uncharacterized protein n=2 Tax=Cryptotermes secundus TaxID=105785 RepID=A0A2J7QNH6_9NEOP|nr:hypothetical protein B7P43_G01261 [Cryptotermes secundus]